MRTAEVLTTEEGEPNPELHEASRHHPSVEEELIDGEEQEARRAIAEADVAAIRKLFAQGDVVHDILAGEEMAMSAEEVREMTGLSPTFAPSARLTRMA